MAEPRWIDLCDPDEATLRRSLPPSVHDLSVGRILRPPSRDVVPRPRLEARTDYVFGVLVAPILTNGETIFQEIDLVCTVDQLVTIRKTPPEHEPYELEPVRAGALRTGASAGMCLYLLVDDIAERFLDIVDSFDDTIDELEDHVRDWPSEKLRARISSTRHDILHVRRVLAPTRDAARAVLDDRVELDAGLTVFPREVELHFADAYDKLLRASDGLELSRDLLAGVRDFHQAEVANDQNEVTKRLTVVASVLLVPTFIVGLYGQNFDHIPELHWAQGYGFSWLLIAVTTILQLWFFRRKQWI